MKDSSVLRAADGLWGRVRSAAERLSRAASCGRTSGRCLRSARARGPERGCTADSGGEDDTCALRCVGAFI